MSQTRGMTVGKTVDTMQLVAEWSRFLEALGRSAETRRNYSYAVVRFLANHPKPLPEISESDIVGFLASLPPRSTAKARYMNGLRSFFAWCRERGHIEHDPTTLLHPKGSAKPPVVALTEEELLRLLRAAELRSPRRRWALQLCYGLGTRRSELINITPADVEDEHVHLRITKGNKPRRVPISEPAREALEALRPWWNGTVLGGVKAQTITNWAQEAAEDAGLPRSKRKAHVLRATFATHLLAKGVPISVVSHMLGHSSVAITSRYLAVTEADELRASRELTLGGDDGES